MQHSITHDAATNTVRITPKNGAVTLRAAIVGGVHGNEWPARLAPAQVVRAFTFRRPVTLEFGTVELLVIPEASPRACALGMRTDENMAGDLNCSWPGLELTGGEAGELTDYSVARAAEVANLLLEFGPKVIVGLHACPDGWCSFGTKAGVEPMRSIEIEHHAYAYARGLPGWAESHGILAVDLEAPSRGDVLGLAEVQAEFALRAVLAMAAKVSGEIQE